MSTNTHRVSLRNECTAEYASSMPAAPVSTAMAAATLGFAAWAITFVRRRRIVFHLGRNGVGLTPAFMLSLALVGLKLGELTGSFAAMCGSVVALHAAACAFAVCTHNRMRWGRS